MTKVVGSFCNLHFMFNICEEFVSRLLVEVAVVWY